jgi:hypothetical protein
VRPHVRLDAQRHREIVWPTVGVWSASLPGSDVLLVLGPEPALRWRTFCDQLVGIAELVGSPLVLTLGALLADVPHTRPTHVIGTATDPTLIERFDLERSRYEGPTGIVGVLQDAFTRAGVPAASLWAAVPGYASQIPSPRAAMVLVERACSMMGTPAPLSGLADQVAEYDARIGALLAGDDDLLTYVARLESILDSGGDDDIELEIEIEIDGPGAAEVFDDSGENLEDADPDALVQEVEQYLRDRDGEH